MDVALSTQQSLYPDGQHTLGFYIKCVPPVGLANVIGNIIDILPCIKGVFNWVGGGVLDTHNAKYLLGDTKLIWRMSHHH